VGPHGLPRTLGVLAFHGFENSLVVVLASIRPAFYLEDPHALFAQNADDGIN
jgi:hypothetical protein